LLYSFVVHFGAHVLDLFFKIEDQQMTSPGTKFLVHNMLL